MQWALFLALAAISAILWNPVNNWLTSQSTKVAGSSTAASTFFGSYFGKTAVTTIAFFSVLLIAATVLNVVSKKTVRVPELT